MRSFTYTIKDELGIHARPAGLLVKEAAKYECNVTVSKGGKNADCKKLFAVMGLGARQGDVITVTCGGGDENEAAKALEGFISEHL